MDGLQKNIPGFVINTARLLYHRLFPPAHSCAYWIRKLVTNEPLSLVHIGSHDGKTGDLFFDLIHEHTHWKVLFVEPVPYLFKRLQENYPSDSRFRFENAAVNDGSSQLFYWVQEDAISHVPDLPKGFDQLGSFDRNNITKHLDGKLEHYIVEASIQGITLQALFSKHSIDKLDILHIDTEGYDWKILSQLDLNKHSPLLILFEHINLSAVEKAQAIQFLKTRFYIVELEADFLCINRNTQKLSKKDVLKLQRIFPLYF
ncbi:FkbM family methyltransferase [Rhodocytophaga rosea]|uniref:FkbM family methyltransferase n=1 Tax=Rhodocytophaga rosea TaxID=2704465 RepID=A0A6C0GNM6_9BACT|nr:FkbM family methyltransferase [Rhodocytophaga rosea]QHT69636.1 FkbM family methyltransferase [Rhodocytophaga rosea]